METYYFCGFAGVPVWHTRPENEPVTEYAYKFETSSGGEIFVLDKDLKTFWDTHNVMGVPYPFKLVGGLGERFCACGKALPGCP